MAPTLVPVIGSALRPLAKALVKTGITMYDSAKDLVAEVGEDMNDMVSEARAEMAEGADRSPRTSEASGERNMGIGQQEKRAQGARNTRHKGKDARRPTRGPFVARAHASLGYGSG